jgi:hypothetical protein
MGTDGAFPVGKAWPGRDADKSPYLLPRSGMSRSYTSSPACRLYGGSGTALRTQILYKYVLRVSVQTLMFTSHVPCELQDHPT